MNDESLSGSEDRGLKRLLDRQAVADYELDLTGLDLASYGDSSSFLRIPLAPMAYFMAAMAFVAALAAIAHFFAGASQEDAEAAG